jgi:hypothetical protein
MAKIDTYITLAKDLIEDDKDRDNLYSGIDDMWHGNWHADGELATQPDFREVIDLSPHDALRAGTTIMATSYPAWHVQPFATNPDERSRAEQIEYILDWHFRQMSQRGTGTVLWDIVHSALRYDAIAIWLDYLPYWTGAKAKGRAKLALRNGPFIASVYNPRFVHQRFDTYGLNCVLHASNKSATDVANYWNSRGGKVSDGLNDLNESLRKAKGKVMFFNNFDMMVYDENDDLYRIVWGELSDSSTLQADIGASCVLMQEKVPYPFMNWIVKIGGSKMETESKYGVHPLLAPLYWTHKWKDQNVYESITHSEVMKYARSPRVMTKTPNGEGIEIDYENGSTLNARTGIEDAEAWKPAPIDPNLKDLLDRGRASISSATLPQILQNPEFAGNTPFASINAIMQTAIGSMNSAKVLCEVATQELGLRMMEWAYDQKDTLYAYRTKSSKANGKEIEIGSEISLIPDDYHPDHLLIKCEYSTKTPTDYAQQLNSAVLAVTQLDYPKAQALEDLGNTNAEILMERRYQERYDETTIAADLQTIQGEAQLAIQAKQMQMQMEMQQTQQANQMQQQSQMGQQQGQPQPNVPEPTGPQQQAMALQAASQQQGGGYPSNTQGNPPQGVPPGMGFNPNAGGISPATANPGINNRETQTGTDVSGNPIR